MSFNKKSMETRILLSCRNEALLLFLSHAMMTPKGASATCCESLISSEGLLVLGGLPWLSHL